MITAYKSQTEQRIIQLKMEISALTQQIDENEEKLRECWKQRDILKLRMDHALGEHSRLKQEANQ